MTRDLQELIEKSRSFKMSDDEAEEQRRSFAYGSAKIENNDITREIIDEAAHRLERNLVDGR
jgi:Fic family protein